MRPNGPVVLETNGPLCFRATEKMVLTFFAINRDGPLEFRCITQNGPSKFHNYRCPLWHPIKNIILLVEVAKDQMLHMMIPGQPGQLWGLCRATLLNSSLSDFRWIDLTADPLTIDFRYQPFFEPT